MSQGDYEVKIKVKKGDPTEVDAGDEEAEFNNDWFIYLIIILNTFILINNRSQF